MIRFMLPMLALAMFCAWFGPHSRLDESAARAFDSSVLSLSFGPGVRKMRRTFLWHSAAHAREAGGTPMLRGRSHYRRQAQMNTGNAVRLQERCRETGNPLLSFQHKEKERATN